LLPKYWRTKGNIAFGARSQLLLIVPCMGARCTVWPTMVNVGFSTQNQKHFLSTHGWSSLRANKNCKTLLLLAHKSLNCVTLIFGFQQFYTCWVSEEKIFRQKFGNFVGESCLSEFARPTAHENVAFWIITVMLKCCRAVSNVQK
jgi:hypothetical protein